MNHLILWADNHNTNLCPIRHLLVYIYLLKIKSGPLFPDYEELVLRPPKDGRYKTSLPYFKFRNKVNQLCDDVIHQKVREGRKSKGLGTHCLRKTGYLFAIWGSKDQSNSEYSRIMSSARHQDVASAMKYELDARTQYMMASYSDSNPRALVGEWKPCFLSDYSNFNYVNHTNPTELYLVTIFNQGGRRFCRKYSWFGKQR